MIDPFIHLFCTKDNKYVYDVNSNDIFCVSDVVYDILHCIKTYLDREEVYIFLSDHYSQAEINDAFQFIEDAEKNGLAFSGHRPTQISMFHCPIHTILKYNTYMEMMTLEVTQNCNLRCRYCCFSDAYNKNRKRSSREMSWETARKSMDYILEHGGSDAKPHLGVGPSRDFSVGFYGGEPLLQFDLVKKCVEYVNSKIEKDRRVRYSLTTNGTLMTSDIAKWLIEHDFSIVFSLDGPPEIHDRQRIYENGMGTHKDVLKAINCYNETIAVSPYDERHASINCVVVGGVDIVEIWEYFVSLEDLLCRKKIKYGVNISGITDGVGVWNQRNSNMPLSEVTGWDRLFKLYEQKCLENFYKDGKNRSLDWRWRLLNDICAKGLYFNVHGRTRFQEENEIRFKNIYHPGSICVMGTKRCYVMVDGRILPCERVPTDDFYFTIGKIDEGGIDVKKTVEKIDEFTNASAEDCIKCWCLRMCSVGCCDGLIVDDNVDKHLKRNRCNKLRDKRHEELIGMMTLLEANPTALDHYHDIIVI